MTVALTIQQNNNYMPTDTSLILYYEQVRTCYGGPENQTMSKLYNAMIFVISDVVARMMNIQIHFIQHTGQ